MKSRKNPRICVSPDADRTGGVQEKKTQKTMAVELSIYAIIHVALIVLAFTKPKVTLWISFAFLLLLILILGGIKWLYKWSLKKAFSNDENELENIAPEVKDNLEFIKVIFIIFCNAVFEYYNKKLMQMMLLLSIPSFIISAVALFRGYLGANTIVFVYIVVGYSLIRLWLHFLSKLLEINEKAGKIIAFVKILLEVARIVVIITSFLYEDGLLGLKLPSSLLHSIVATIAIDSIMKEISKTFFRPLKEECSLNPQIKTP